VLEEKRRLLDRAIGAIANAEKLIQSGQPAGAVVLKEIIEAIEMQMDFMKNYHRDEAWVSFKAHHRHWPSHEWNNLFRDIQSALAEDPASPTGQALAARWRKLRVHDSGGDPKVHSGLLKAWNDRQYWPAEVQNRFSAFDLDRISQFIAKAFAVYRIKRHGEIVYSKDLDQFTPEDKERPALAIVDLYFRIAEFLDSGPLDEAAQALAACWMELVESRTGATSPEFKSSLQWIR
jgi:hypothetical protein